MATAGMATSLSQHPLLQSGKVCIVQSSRNATGAVPFLSRSTRLLRTGSQRHYRMRMEAGGNQESIHFQKPSILPLSGSPVVLKRTSGDEAALSFATVSVVARQAGLPPPAENEGLVTEAGPIGILDPDNKELWLSKVEWVDPRVDIDPVSIKRGARLQLRTERQPVRPIAALSEQHSKSDNLVSSVRKALPPSIRDQPWAMPGLSAAVLLVLALIWTLFRKKDEIQEKGGVSTPYGNSPPGGGTGVVKSGERYSALQLPRKEVSYKLGQSARKTEELVSRFVHKTERAVEKVEDVAKDVAEEAAKKTQQSLAGLKKEVKKVQQSDDKGETIKQEASKVAEKGKQEASKAADKTKEATKDVIEDGKKRVETVKRSDDKVEASVQEVKKVAEKGKEVAKDAVEEGKERLEESTGRSGTGDSLKAKVEAPKSEDKKDRVDGSSGRSGTADSQKRSRGFWDLMNRKGDKPVISGVKDAPTKVNEELVKAAVGDPAAKLSAKPLPEKTSSTEDKSTDTILEKTSSVEEKSTDTTPKKTSSAVKTSDTSKTPDQKGGIVSGVEGSDPKALESLVKSAVGKPSEAQPDSNGKPSSPPFQAKPAEPTPKAEGDSDKPASKGSVAKPPQATATKSASFGKTDVQKDDSKPKAGGDSDKPASKGSVSKPPQASATKSASSGKSEVQKEFEALSKLVGKPEKTDSKQESMQTVVSELSQAIEQSKQALLPPADDAADKDKRENTTDGPLSPSARFAQDIAQRATSPRPPVDVSKFAPKPRQEEDLDDGPLSPSLQLARDIRLRAKGGPFVPTSPPPEVSKPASDVSKPEEEEDTNSPSAQLARDIKERAKSGMSFPTSPPADFITPGPKPAPKPDQEDDNDVSQSPSLQFARDIKQRAKGSPFIPSNPPPEVSKPAPKLDQEDDNDVSQSPSLQFARDIKQRAKGGPFVPQNPPSEVSKPAPKPDQEDDNDDPQSPSLQLARDIKLRAKGGPFFPTSPPPEVSKPAADVSKSDQAEDNDSPSAQLARDIKERAKSGMSFPTSPPADFSTPPNRPAPKPDHEDDNDDPPSPSLQLARDIKQRAKGGPFFPTNPPPEVSKSVSKPSAELDKEDDSQVSPSLQLARDIKQRAATGPFFPVSTPSTEATSAPTKGASSPKSAPSDASADKTGSSANSFPWARKSDVIETTPTQPTKPVTAADVSKAPASSDASNGKPSEASPQSVPAAKAGSNWWAANRAKPAGVISQTPTTTAPERDLKPSPIATAASQAPTKPVTVTDSKPAMSAPKPSAVASSSPARGTSKARQEGSNGASKIEGRAGEDPAQIVEKIFVEDLPLPKLSGKKAALRQQLVAKLQNVLPAVAVSIGAAGALTGGIDGALETVGFTALASFATSTLLWANSRDEFKKELEEIKSSKDLREFIQEKVD